MALVFEDLLSVEFSIAIDSDQLLQTLFYLETQFLDQIHVLALSDNLQQNVETKVVFDQDFERLCLVEVFSKVHDGLLVADVDDLFDDV